MRCDISEIFVECAKRFGCEHSQFVPNELKTVQQDGYLTMIWRESCNFPGFQPGGSRIAGVQRRLMRRGQESPWLKFMENKGRSLMKWSKNYPAGQLQCRDKLGMLPFGSLVRLLQSEVI